jgi:hypothetical protein
LESVHEPRARAFDALQLMRHFDEFLAEQPLNSPIFTDPDRVFHKYTPFYHYNTIII